MLAVLDEQISSTQGETSYKHTQQEFQKEGREKKEEAKKKKKGKAKVGRVTWRAGAGGITLPHHVVIYKTNVDYSFISEQLGVGRV